MHVRADVAHLQTRLQVDHRVLPAVLQRLHRRPVLPDVRHAHPGRHHPRPGRRAHVVGQVHLPDSGNVVFFGLNSWSLWPEFVCRPGGQPLQSTVR